MLSQIRSYIVLKSNYSQNSDLYNVCAVAFDRVERNPCAFLTRRRKQPFKFRKQVYKYSWMKRRKNICKINESKGFIQWKYQTFKQILLILSCFRWRISQESWTRTNDSNVTEGKVVTLQLFMRNLILRKLPQSFFSIPQANQMLLF